MVELAFFMLPDEPFDIRVIEVRKAPRRLVEERLFKRRVEFVAEPGIKGNAEPCFRARVDFSGKLIAAGFAQDSFADASLQLVPERNLKRKLQNGERLQLGLLL